MTRARASSDSSSATAGSVCAGLIVHRHAFVGLFQSGAGLLQIDLFGALGQVGQHPNVVWQHFHETAVDRQNFAGSGLRSKGQRSASQQAQQRRVTLLSQMSRKRAKPLSGRLHPLVESIRFATVINAEDTNKVRRFQEEKDAPLANPEA